MALPVLYFLVKLEFGMLRSCPKKGLPELYRALGNS